MGSFFLGGGGDVGVGVEGEACGEVTEHTADRLDVHAILEGDSCKGMAEVVESDLRYTCSSEDSFEHIVHAVRGDGTAVGGREDVLVIRLCFLLF